MKFENETITEDIIIDDNEFINCVIRDCVVTYCGGEFKLVDTVFDQIKVNVRGSARDTVSFLTVLRASDAIVFEGLMHSGSNPTLTASIESIYLTRSGTEDDPLYPEPGSI